MLQVKVNKRLETKITKFLAKIGCYVTQDDNIVEQLLAAAKELHESNVNIVKCLENTIEAAEEAYRWS